MIVYSLWALKGNIGRMHSSVLNIISVMLLVPGIENYKMVTIPYKQVECPCEHKAIDAHLDWETNDDGDPICSGFVEYLELVEEPIMVECKVESQRRGNWHFFLQQSFPHFCTNIFDETKPYHFLVSQFPNRELGCPFTPLGLLPFEGAVFNADMSSFIELTPDDIGIFRMNVSISGNVGNVTKQVFCQTVYFEILDGEE